MPPDLEKLLRDILGSIATTNDTLANDRITVDQWQRLVATDVLVGHYAAFMSGKGSKELTAAEQKTIKQFVGEQVDYLNRFADQIEADGWRDGFGARALLYGATIKASYYRGRLGGIDLGFTPGDGSTPCLSNCGCSIEIDWQDEDNLDADVYWKLGKTESCSVCIERASHSPYRFREGVMA